MFGDRSSKSSLAGGFGKLHVTAGVTQLQRIRQLRVYVLRCDRERASCGFYFNFERTKLRRHSGYGRREMKLKRITKIVHRFVFCFPLARHINFDALRDEPFIFLPNASGEFSFHVGYPLTITPMIAPIRPPTRLETSGIHHRPSRWSSTARECKLIAVSIRVLISPGDKGSRETFFFSSSPRALYSSTESRFSKSTWKRLGYCLRQTSEAHCRVVSRRKNSGCSSKILFQ